MASSNGTNGHAAAPPRMAFAGLGMMGKAIATQMAVRAPHTGPMLYWNRTHSVAEALGKTVDPEGKGIAKPVTDLAAAVANSDIIWSCLLNDGAVMSVFDTMLSSGSVAGKLFVDCSTTTSETAKQISKRVTAAGAEIISMPVFGAPFHAALGKLIVIPAGPKAAVDRITPFLQGVMAGSVINLGGEDSHQSQMLKNIGNVGILATIEQCAEMLVFAEKCGLGTENVRKLYAALYPGGPQQHLFYSGLMSNGEWMGPSPVTTIDTAIALSDKISGIATGLGVQLKTYEIARQHLREARAASSGSADILSIYGAVRLEAGMKYKSE